MFSKTHVYLLFSFIHQTFTDWKSQVKGKARRLKVAQKETGNAGDIPKNLTDLEERLLNIIGRVVVTGMDGVPELGTVGK